MLPEKYTCICYQKKSYDQVPSPSIREHLITLRHQPDVVSFSFFTDIMTTSLSENEGIDKKEVESARKNLRRTIQECYSDEFRFQTISQRLFIYPDTLTLEVLVSKHIDLKTELEGCESISKDEKLALDVAKSIRNEITSLNDKMP